MFLISKAFDKMNHSLFLKPMFPDVLDPGSTFLHRPATKTSTPWSPKPLPLVQCNLFAEHPGCSFFFFFIIKSTSLMAELLFFSPK